jgi:hypothetical protein
LLKIPARFHNLFEIVAGPLFSPFRLRLAFLNGPSITFDDCVPLVVSTLANTDTTRDRRRTDFGSRSVRRGLPGFVWLLLPRQQARQELYE